MHIDFFTFWQRVIYNSCIVSTNSRTNSWSNNCRTQFDSVIISYCVVVLTTTSRKHRSDANGD